jgi:hypothetical protein
MVCWCCMSIFEISLGGHLFLIQRDQADSFFLGVDQKFYD